MIWQSRFVCSLEGLKERVPAVERRYPDTSSAVWKTFKYSTGQGSERRYSGSSSIARKGAAGKTILQKLVGSLEGRQETILTVERPGSSVEELHVKELAREVKRGYPESFETWKTLRQKY